uniref:Uncharacterized protein n=1 Tax=Cynoglossus semilaevis TaxID=244447 RepID=A0A3P8VEN6_CYNSE
MTVLQEPVQAAVWQALNHYAYLDAVFLAERLYAEGWLKENKVRMTSSQSLETRRLLLCLYWATFIGNDEVTPVCLSDCQST